MSDERPRLASKARLRWDAARRQTMLVWPERGLALNETAAAIVTECDGSRTIAQIVVAIAERFDAPRERVEADVRALLESLRQRGLVEGAAAGAEALAASDDRDAAPRPYTLIAELTYRCPLKCPYCSNPVDLDAHATELSTTEWEEIFSQAAELGVVQLHLTGGEPLARKDLERLAAKARALGLYTNLVTSGVPLTRERLASLRDAGVDAVQVSVQDTDEASADRIAGYACLPRKLEVMAWVKELGLPLTMNVVLHRANLDRVDAVVALAERVGADRLELANVQFLGWALKNREALMPAREQLERAHAVALEAKARLAGKMEVLFVKPDYFGAYPKACMDGWARRFLHLMADGTTLPCHAAATIPNVAFDRAPAKPLREIWETSDLFSRFRGDAWMPEPCRSCDRKGVDFGGCRCQALALTGDATRTDPACTRSPDHALVARAVDAREERRYLYRGARGG
jgi:pyrroloquinoline quinone biosynthesis protein E